MKVMTTSRIYSTLIALGLIVAIVGVWYARWFVVSLGGGAALFFFSCELGVIIHQYQGMARLLEIHNGLIIASLKAQGYAIEGAFPTEEP